MNPIRRGASPFACLVLVAGFTASALPALPALASEPSSEPTTKRAPRRHVSKRPPHRPEVPEAAAGGTEHGNASYYAHRFTGRRTASGEAYDPSALTAAHRTLPLGTQVRVVNPKNDRSVVVTVNDRGPIAKNRLIDVSSAAADQLQMKQAGVTRVRTHVVGKDDAPKDANGAKDPDAAAASTR